MVKMRNNVSTEEVTSVTQGTAALDEENTLCHKKQGPTQNNLAPVCTN